MYYNIWGVWSTDVQTDGQPQKHTASAAPLEVDA